MMNLDGTRLRQLTNSTLTETTPAWSPDGEHIALAAAPPGDSWYSSDRPRVGREGHPGDR
ncbi:MAG: PD40 domain-containing protein [Fibrella sp.]|nr:PD40 domain-containing protein [Armatimonadota bacterium]